MYQLDITLDGQHIKDSPLSITATPGVPDPLNFEWDDLALDSEGRRIVVAGVTDSFKVSCSLETHIDYQIASKDAYGNLCTTGGLDIEGALTGTDNVPVMVADNGNGTYSVSYTPKKAGPYDLDVKVNGKRVGGQDDKPVKLLCIPAKASGKNSIAFGPGIENATIGDDNKFTVQARDAFGNNLTMGGATVGGSVKTPNGTVFPVQAIDNNDGTYECSYPGVSQAGTFQLTPTLEGESVKGKLNIVGASNHKMPHLICVFGPARPILTTPSFMCLAIHWLMTRQLPSSFVIPTETRERRLTKTTSELMLRD